MHLLTQSALLKALGWSLFNSLWQMALLWLVYILLTTVFRRASAGARHFLALALLGAGTGWFLMSFIGGVFSEGELPGYAWVSRQFIDLLLPYCSFFYLLALIFLFTRYSGHYIHSKRLKVTGLAKIQPELRVFVEETSRRMGIGKEVRVWLSSLVEVPVTLGFLKPVILIPIATINNLSIQQVEAILLHELAHIKRYDYLLNLGVTVLELVFFFNPFSRWLIHDIKREREHRCDDLVMQFRYDPFTYVSALLLLASKGRQRQEIALAATGKNDRILLRRVKRILKQKNTDGQPGTRPVIFLLFTVMLAFIGLSRPAHPLFHFVRDDRQVSVRWQPDTGPEDSIFRWANLDKQRQPGSASLEFPSVVMTRTGDATGRRKPVIAGRHRQPVSTDPDDAGDMDLADNIILASNKTSDNDEDPGYVEVQDLKLSIAPVQPEPREYSIRLVAPAGVAVSPYAVTSRNLPYVPYSSFSSGHTEDSVYRLQQQVGAAEKAARDEMERGMKLLKTQQDVLTRLQETPLYNIKPLSRLVSRGRRPDIRRLEKELSDEQSRLKKEYLRKQQEAQKKLPAAQRTKVIIYL